MNSNVDPSNTPPAGGLKEICLTSSVNELISLTSNSENPDQPPERCSAILYKDSSVSIIAFAKNNTASDHAAAISGVTMSPKISPIASIKLS